MRIDEVKKGEEPSLSHAALANKLIRIVNAIANMTVPGGKFTCTEENAILETGAGQTVDMICADMGDLTTYRLLGERLADEPA